MNRILNLSGKAGLKINLQLMMLIGAAMIGVLAAFPLSYIASTNVLLGVALFPFALFMSDQSRINYLYLSILLAFCCLAFIFQLKIFYFFAIAFFILFILEVFIGRVNSIILFLIAVMSPVFHQVSVILGFPIRLKLSEWAGSLLTTVGLDVQTEGNMMVLDGFSFTVDEACMGLNMLAISMMMGVFVIAHQYRISKRQLSFEYLVIFFLAVLFLNIISNLFRIMILVMFKILPQNPLHEIIGIIGLVVYVMIPLYFLAKAMINKRGTALQQEISHAPLSRTMYVIVVVLTTFVMTTGFAIKPNRAESNLEHAEVTMAGMDAVELSGGITKMYNDKVLIYVKPIPEFFSGEHTPLICWKGSGYSFKKITKATIGNVEIYCGTLCKNQQLLHTAWWYTDGKINTIDQLVWRTAMLKGGERFNVVNITAKDAATLLQNVRAIFQNNLLTVNSVNQH